MEGAEGGCCEGAEATGALAGGAAVVVGPEPVATGAVAAGGVLTGAAGAPLLAAGTEGTGACTVTVVTRVRLALRRATAGCLRDRARLRPTVREVARAGL